MSEPILTVNHLSFGFRDQQLYQDLSFQLNVGSMTSLVGPNGVGKTTLIRLLMAQLKPQAGTIRFRQQPPVRLGYVPQFRNVDTEFPLSIRSFIQLRQLDHLFFWHTGKEKAALDAVIKATHLGKIADTRLGMASGGEKQKAYLAQALLDDPNFLILDESTASLDVNTKQELMDLVQELNQTRQLTVLFVTHDLSLAKKYTQQYLLLTGSSYEMKPTAQMDLKAMPEEIRNDAENRGVIA